MAFRRLLNQLNLIWVLGGAVRKSMFSSTVNILVSYIEIVYKQCGTDWQAIVDELHAQGFTHRTKEHIKSLYYKVMINDAMIMYLA